MMLWRAFARRFGAPADSASDSSSSDTCCCRCTFVRLRFDPGPVSIALAKVCTSSSSCANSLFSRIAFACSRLMRPVMPRSARICFSRLIWSEGRSRSLNSFAQTLRTPHATTRDFSRLTVSSSFDSSFAGGLDFFSLGSLFAFCVEEPRS